MLGRRPADDHPQLVRDGRRVQPGRPEQSLLLRKATLAELHGGGRRFSVDSPDYQLLYRWIRAGAPADAPSPAQVRILPSRVTLDRPESRAPLAVWATWPDGTREEVTGLVEFRTAEPLEVQVDQQGVLRRGTRVGSSGITAQYGPHSAAITVVAPGPRAVVPRLPVRNPIDRFIGDRLAELRLPPSPDSDDREFLRRASLDTLGHLPSRDELARFLADRAPDRRARRVEAMLQDERAAWRWANFLAVWSGCDEAELRHRQGEAGGPPAEQLAYLWLDWLRYRMARDVPYPEILRGIFLATSREGKSRADWERQERALEIRMARQAYQETLYATRPTCDVYWRTETHSLRPMKCAEAVSRRFLGVNMDCVRCHDHPYERWLQSEHHGLVDILDRTTYMPSPPLRFAQKVQLALAGLLSLGLFAGGGALQVLRLRRQGRPRRAAWMRGGWGVGGALTLFALFCSLYLVRPGLPTEYQSPGLWAASVLEPVGLRGAPVAWGCGALALLLVLGVGRLQWNRRRDARAAFWLPAVGTVFLGTCLDVGYVVGRHGTVDRRGWVQVLYRKATGGETGEGVQRRWEVFVLDPAPEDRRTILLPDGTPLRLGTPDDRKPFLAWLCDPRNPWTARNFVNRIWAQYFGRGLVEPLDGLATHPATHPELLDWLAADFVAHGWSLRHLHRRILTSATYQLASRPHSGNRTDVRHYARFYPRRLSAEHLLQAVDTVLGTRSDFELPLPVPEPTVFQIPVLSPGNQTTAARAFRMLGRLPSTSDNLTSEGVLFTLSDKALWKRIEEPGGRLRRPLEQKVAPAALLREYYEVALTRPPDKAEEQAALRHLAASPSPLAGWQDLVWALLNTTEFQCQH